MTYKLGNLTTNIVAEIGIKLVAKGLFSDDEMQEVLEKAVVKTAKEQQQQKEMKVCNSTYSQMN
tara:strand:+ start:152 stop:343 length:192 start_codon:yes stop_codon:yes gene_type:complete